MQSRGGADAQKIKSIKYKNQHQKRVFLDLADQEKSSDVSTSSLKAITREGSSNSNSSYRKVPFSTKLIFNRSNKMYDSNEREVANQT
jgi:hypothetical protein